MVGGGERGGWREGGMHGIFAFEAYGFDNGFCYLFDADFFVFANCGLEVLDGRRTEGGGGGMRREGLEWEGRGEERRERNAPERMIGSTSSYSLNIQINIFARSYEYINWRTGFRVLYTAKGAL